MSLTVKVEETEIQEVLAWAFEHGEQMTTDHEEGTYEQGVFDAINWILGYISSRPDH
ncbi:hypothetical protein [Nitrincola iocasae]|uniref:hypothetical protein n=1 Tax=Nitrincola iocasae TaxID=2614693 RepID=UPI00177E1BA3|nr:hypothetical protein [Nitrincola iocasae]